MNLEIWVMELNYWITLIIEAKKNGINKISLETGAGNFFLNLLENFLKKLVLKPVSLCSL